MFWIRIYVELKKFSDVLKTGNTDDIDDVFPRLSSVPQWITNSFVSVKRNMKRLLVLSLVAVSQIKINMNQKSIVGLIYHLPLSWYCYNHVYRRRHHQSFAWVYKISIQVSIPQVRHFGFHPDVHCYIRCVEQNEAYINTC